MKRKKLVIYLMAAAVLASGSTVSAAEFSSGEDSLKTQEEPLLTDEVVDEAEFNDGNVLQSEPEFGDTASEELPVGDIPIDEAHFPDKYFRKFLLDPQRDKNMNDILEAKEIAQITSIKSSDFGPYGWLSMEGVEYLTSLEELDLQFLPTYNSEETKKVYLDLSPLSDLKILNTTYFPAQGYGYLEYYLDLSKNFNLRTLNLTCDVVEMKLPENNKIEEYHCYCWHQDGSGDVNHNNSHDDSLLTYAAQMPNLRKYTIRDFEEPHPDTIKGRKITKRTPTSVTFKWTGAKKEYDGYVMTIFEANGNLENRIEIERGVTSKTITGLEPGKRYQILLRAYRRDGNKVIYSSDPDKEFICCTLPKTVTVKGKQISGRKVKLNWEGAFWVSDDGGYIVYYRNAKSKEYKKLTQVNGLSTYYKTKALKKNNTYYFKVKGVLYDAEKGKDLEGAWSKPVKVRIK